MAPSTSTTKESAPKKVKSKGGSGRKKLTAFNKYMKAEMARLKEEQPEITHRDRFKLATENWKNAEENPRKEA